MTIHSLENFQKAVGINYRFLDRSSYVSALLISRFLYLSLPIVSNIIFVNLAAQPSIPSYDIANNNVEGFARDIFPQLTAMRQLDLSKCTFDIKIFIPDHVG